MAKRILWHRMTDQELHAAWAQRFPKMRRPANRRLIVAKLTASGGRGPKLTPEEWIAEQRAAAADGPKCEHGVSMLGACAECKAARDLVSRIESGSVVACEECGAYESHRPHCSRDLVGEPVMIPAPEAFPPQQIEIVQPVPLDVIKAQTERLKASKKH